MKIVIFGLSITSSWGNGHATLWRGLCRALVARGHDVSFFERDVPYYARTRDLHDLPGGQLVLYPDWSTVRRFARGEVEEADVALVTSYCPDAAVFAEEMIGKAALSVFYDLDTPVTLSRLAGGQTVEYLGERALRDFDLVLSYTGGAALEELQTQLGARRVAPLYGSVDPDFHQPVEPRANYRGDLSFLGTYAEDRQAALQNLFIESARRRAEASFVIGGALYPPSFPWARNISFVRHLPPAEHPAFFCSSRLTLSVTRRAMALMGYCPSGRLFEAAACGIPILTDWWMGMEEFFDPCEEIIPVRGAEEVLLALDLPEKVLKTIARAARERVLAEHTAECRAEQFEDRMQEAMSPSVEV
ncbi:MAG: glycosyltransferase [Verrucomicrobiota bacterium]|nr:glycosyltransferase [Verrucomicrobiota bacterium]